MKVKIDGVEYIPITALKAHFNAIQLMKAMMGSWATEEMMDTDEKVLKLAQELRVCVSDNFSEIDEDTPSVLDVVSEVLKANSD